MPIDAAAVTSAEPRIGELSWTPKDVQLYHLALGAGAQPTDPLELRYTYERDLQVLPTFGVVAGGGVGFSLFDLPGMAIDLAAVLHGGQEITVHRPLPVYAKAARSSTHVPAVYDKGKAAVIVLESSVTGDDGEPLFTQRSQIFVRGEGGFGGERGPSAKDETPEREPDHVIEVPTLPQQALLYRLCGDVNPLHADPGFAKLAGFDRPILHGLCSYGIVAKAVTDRCLDGDVGRISAYRTRFAGIFFPGETMRVRVWNGDGRLHVRATAVERDDAVVLADTVLTHSQDI